MDRVSPRFCGKARKKHSIPPFQPKNVAFFPAQIFSPSSLLEEGNVGLPVSCSKTIFLSKRICRVAVVSGPSHPIFQTAWHHRQRMPPWTPSDEEASYPREIKKGRETREGSPALLSWQFMAGGWRDSQTDVVVGGSTGRGGFFTPRAVVLRRSVWWDNGPPSLPKESPPATGGA